MSNEQKEALTDEHKEAISDYQDSVTDIKEDLAHIVKVLGDSHPVVKKFGAMVDAFASFTQEESVQFYEAMQSRYDDLDNDSVEEDDDEED